MILMTKYQAALIRELVCPRCKCELWQLSRFWYHCGVCGEDYNGEEKRGPHAGH